MSHLVTTYASFLGLKIDKPHLREDFFPLPTEDRYITLQSSSVNQDAKNYEYWNEVVGIISPILHKNNIKIVHIGLKEDLFVHGVDFDLRGKMTLQQTQYVLKRGMLHVGVDSCWIHIAGFNNLPVVGIYGSTTPDFAGPYWSNKAKTALIESHRCGLNPTYSKSETPKTINFIRPEDIASKVLQFLEVEHNIDYVTEYIGVNYSSPTIDLIPNVGIAASYNPEIEVIVRMDLLHNEKVLSEILQTGRKVHIICNRELSETAQKMLEFARSSIITFNHEIVDTYPVSPLYVQRIKRLIKDSLFYVKSVSEEKLAAIRLKYFGYTAVTEAEDRTREQFLLDYQVYNNKKLDSEFNLSNLYFKSSKYVFSEGKIFPSYAHYKRGISIDKSVNNNHLVIDDPDFWKDFQSYLIKRFK